MVSGTPGESLFNAIESMYGDDIVGYLSFGYALGTDSSSFQLGAYGSTVGGVARSNLGYTGLGIYGGAYYFGLDWYGGSVATARITTNLRVDSDWSPHSSDDYDLGTSTYKWRDIHISRNAYIPYIANALLPSTSKAYALGSSSYYWKYAYINQRIYSDDSLSVYIGGSQTFQMTSTEIIAGNTLRPSADNSKDLGTSSLRWRYIYLVNDPDVSSSRKIKWNIHDTLYGLAEVLKLRPVEYMLKREKKNKIGLIAEEVKKVLPEVSDGNSIKPTMIIPVLVKAIQELNHKVDMITAKN